MQEAPPISKRFRRCFFVLTGGRRGASRCNQEDRASFRVILAKRQNDRLVNWFGTMGSKYTVGLRGIELKAQLAGCYTKAGLRAMTTAGIYCWPVRNIQ